MKFRNILAVAVAAFAVAVPTVHAQETQAAPVAHRFIAADKGKVAIINQKGEVEWEVPNGMTCHDISVLPNGNVLMPTSNTKIVEMTPAKEIVWQHESKRKDGYDGAVEIHGFQRLENGLTMVAESGNARIIEVDKDDNIVHQMALTVENPNSHRDTRLVRKLENGNYLVCHELDATVREYEPSGKVVWSYKLDLAGRERTPNHDGHGTEVFGAIRLKNGNTMIAGGNNNRVFEVNPKGETVWSIDNKELPEIQLFWVTSLQQLPNGNLVFGNTHAGPNNPQLIEVTRDKKVVWKLQDWNHFGNDLCASQLLDVEGEVIR